MEMHFSRPPLQFSYNFKQLRYLWMSSSLFFNNKITFVTKDIKEAVTAPFFNEPALNEQVRMFQEMQIIVCTAVTEVSFVQIATATEQRRGKSKSSNDVNRL